jgi:hypothetical protein
MTRAGSVVVTLSWILLVLLSSAAPAAADPGQAGCFPTCGSATGNGSNIDVSVVKGKSEQVTGRGDGTTGRAPGRTTWTTIDEVIAPACSGNSRTSPDLLCNAALTCPADNLVRFWVWHQVTEWKIGDPPASEPVVTKVGSWYQEPGSFCLGADDPGITPIGVVIAEVQSGFQSLPLPSNTPVVSPAPSTLVNIPTRLSAGEASPFQMTVEPVPGITVTVNATPTEWRWTYGDGQGATTTVPSTEHVYTEARDRQASVRVTWTGTFTFGGQTFPIRTPAYVTSAPVTVDVREARSELVRD